MKRFIIFGLLFAICWLDFLSGLTPNGCPHCWPRGTQGRKPYICEKKGQCPCRHGHTNFRCSGCLPGFHPNGAYCCEKEKYHIGRKICKDCECNPDGVNTTVFRHCDRQGICTCRDGYGGPKCFEKKGPDCSECNPDGVKKDVVNQCNDQGICTCRSGYGGPKCFKPSAQKVAIGDYAFDGLISVYCNGKCKIRYIRVTSEGILDFNVSDKPFVYDSDNEEAVTDGEELCYGESVEVSHGKKKECKYIAGFEVTEFHIDVVCYGSSINVKLEFDADNYLSHTYQEY